MRRWIGLILFFCAAVDAWSYPSLTWPTPNPSFLRGESIEHFIQPTASGDPVSGTYGCVRNDGYRPHEGVDLKPMRRDARGEPTDPVFAALPGKVVYTAKNAGQSNYGRYIVLEHTEAGLTFQTLYAHLARIYVSTGETVHAGEPIALMGHSSSDAFPAERAHLHFEMNMRLCDSFEPWFKRQKYDTPNYHGNYNGFNFSHWNPLAFYLAARKDKTLTAAEFLRHEPTCIIAIVKTREIPGFIRRNTGLLTEPIPAVGVGGWQVEFTPDGLPKLWTPLKEAPRTKLLLTDGSAAQWPCYKLKESPHRPAKELKRELELLFGGRF